MSSISIPSIHLKRSRKVHILQLNRALKDYFFQQLLAGLCLELNQLKSLLCPISFNNFTSKSPQNSVLYVRQLFLNNTGEKNY